MKKFIALLLTLVMALSLVACGSSAPAAPEAPAADATDAIQDAVDAVVDEGEKPYLGKNRFHFYRD